MTGKKKEKHEKSKKNSKADEKSRENIGLIVTTLSILLGIVMGYASAALISRSSTAIIAGLLFLFVYHQGMLRAIKSLEKEEIRGLTILPFLTAWYAAWVFFYNYLAG